MEELEDRFNIRLEGSHCRYLSIRRKSCITHLLTLRLALIRQNNTTPSIHNSFAKRNNVVEHFDINVRAGGYDRCLLEDLGDDRKVCVEVCSDSLSNVSERLEDCRLQLIRRALQKRLSEGQVLIYYHGYNYLTLKLLSK